MAFLQVGCKDVPVRSKLMSYAHIKLDSSGHSSGMAEVDEKCQVIFSYVTSLLQGCFHFPYTPDER